MTTVELGRQKAKGPREEDDTGVHYERSRFKVSELESAESRKRASASCEETHASVLERNLGSVRRSGRRGSAGANKQRYAREALTESQTGPELPVVPISPGF